MNVLRLFENKYICFFYIEIGKYVKSYMLIYENSAFYFMMCPSDADEEIQIFAYDD